MTRSYPPPEWRYRAEPRRTARDWLLDGLLCLVAVAIVLAMLGMCGCGSATQTALAAMTRTVSAAVPMMIRARALEGEACFQDHADYRLAHDCIVAVRARWAPAWAALDLLEQVDEAALRGEARVEDACAAYAVVGQFVTLPVAPVEVCQ